MRALRLLAFSAVLALAAGCVKPAGSCSATADCSANETCDGGVCIRHSSLGGGGSGGGTVPSTYTPVTWSSLQGEAAATFRPDSVSADGSSGDVLVAGAIDGTFTPWGLSTGAFLARFDGATGAPSWSFPLPTFSHGAFRAALRPDGLVVFAASTARTTTLGTLPPFVPPPEGELLLGVLDPAIDDAVWVKPVVATSASNPLLPVAVALLGNDLVLAGAGAGDFGCGPTGGKTFVAALSGADGTCLWSRGFANRSIADVVPRDAGDVVVGGVCAPSGASFDPGGGTTCASGLWVAALGAATGAPTIWARTGSGAVSAVRDLAVTPDGSITAVGDATGGLVSFGGAPVDFGAYGGSFAARFAADGTPGAVVRPIEAPYAPVPDGASLDRCAADRLGKVWIAGRYLGQPTLGGALFPACRLPDCATASYLARLEADGTVSSFLPLAIAPLGDGSAYADDLVLVATTGTLAHALGFTGKTAVGTSAWTSAGPADLGVLRILP